MTSSLNSISIFFKSSGVPLYTENNQFHKGILLRNKAILAQEEQRREMGRKRKKTKGLLTNLEHFIAVEKKDQNTNSENGAKEETLLYSS